MYYLGVKIICFVNITETQMKQNGTALKVLSIFISSAGHSPARSRQLRQYSAPLESVPHLDKLVSSTWMLASYLAAAK